MMREAGRVSLDPRLSMIANLVGECNRCADIGCDHGRLGAFLLQNGRCKRVVLTDISDASLAKARRLFSALNLSDRADFRVGDGALALDAPVDASVIAGMGGSTIAKIIREGRDRLAGATLLLQPNVAAPELRGALSECGYRIADERVAQDGRRSYVVIKAVSGQSDYGLRERIVGPVLLERLPPELLPYARFRLRVAKKAIGGARLSGDSMQIEPLAAEIEIWEEVLSCLTRQGMCSSW